MFSSKCDIAIFSKYSKGLYWASWEKLMFTFIYRVCHRYYSQAYFSICPLFWAFSSPPVTLLKNNANFYLNYDLPKLPLFWYFWGLWGDLGTYGEFLRAFGDFLGLSEVFGNLGDFWRLLVPCGKYIYDKLSLVWLRGILGDSWGLWGTFDNCGGFF